MFGFTGTIHMLLNGLVRIYAVANFSDETKNTKEFMLFVGYHEYRYLFDSLWCFEDFKLTLFLKAPLFLVINLVLHSYHV